MADNKWGDSNHADCVDAATTDYLDVKRDSNTNEPCQISHGDGPFVTETTLSGFDGSTFGMTGRAPQNEDGTGSLSVILARAMTLRFNEIWVSDGEKPTGSEGGVDWCLRFGDKRADIQVTRVNSQARWALLGARRAVGGAISSREAADEIWAAIDKKRLKQDETVILALDARYPSSHLFQPMIDEFRRVYGAQVLQLRWEQVWLVGFNEEVTTCLAERRRS